MNYILVLDTETANTLTDEFGNNDMSNTLVYDIGWAIVDKQGNVYKTASYMVSEMFFDNKDLMNTCYYAEKIPNYWKEQRYGKRKVLPFEAIRTKMLEDMVNYHIDTVSAHNARFDMNALNVTRRYLSKSRYRYFFPHYVTIWDTMKMAQSTICKMPSYKKYCKTNGYLCANGQVRKTAEILFRFISKNDAFIESHTALEDVLIEKDILVACFSKHKKMNKNLYKNENTTPLTEEEDSAIISVESEMIING